MSLPVVLEIALGSVFIYLTLSLIASELQEILGTVFQWRAEHLKYSIESLLAGRDNGDTSEARQLADQLYASPLIRDLNYEAKGSFARTPRRILHVIGNLYRLLTRSRNVFGRETSGPSYIPAETFAASLLESLQLEQIQQVLAQSRLRQFMRDRISIPVSETVADLKASLGSEETLSTELRHLETVLGQIFSDYQARRVDLARTLDRVMAQLDTFAEQSAEVLPASTPYTETYLRRLHYLRRGLVSQVDTAEVWAQKIQPTLQDLLLLLDQSSAIYQEVSRIATQDGGNARAILERLQAQNLPAPLRESLLTLAERAQLKVNRVEGGLTLFQTEIESWFDRAMDRAGGVYKRNAKAVGLLLGFAIAMLVNADTFYMVSRLGVDQAVRSSVIQTVDDLDLKTLDSLAADLALDDAAAGTESPTAVDNPDAAADANGAASTLTQDLKSLGEVVQQTLAEYPIPVGHTDTIVRAQAEAEDSWPLPIPRRWLGWLVTGIAISMGSSFWFDALRRVMSVRTSGSKPTTSK
ncbi:MAG: hypothetical protein AAFU71_09135 [Cyanobacteria bacterium J06632_22]